MIKKKIAVAALAVLAGPIFADDAPSHFDEPGIYPGRAYVNQHFAEHIDPLSGSLQLHYVDIFLPGNGGFDLKVQRSYNLRKVDEHYSPFGRGWDIHFGRVKNRAAHTTCQSAANFKQSMSIELPDGSLQALHLSNGFGATTTSDFITAQLWKARCDMDSGGLIVYSPDGSQYDMTYRSTRLSPSAGYWLVEKITDRNGNSASFTYAIQSDSGRAEVKTITTSDSRSVTFNYTSSRLSSITVNGRTWSYSVVSGSQIGISGDNTYYLQKMTPPAGAAWQYAYFGNQGTSAGSSVVQKVTNPQGGTISYDYGYQTFLPAVIGATQSTVVKKKTTTDATWTFAYVPSAGANQFDETTVTPSLASLGKIVYKHYGYNTGGGVWKIGLLKEKAIGTDQTETYEWDYVTISDEYVTRQGYQNTDTSVKKPVLSKKTVTRENTYTTTYSIFDAYGNPTTIAESGNSTRTRTGITYFDPTTKWIIGLTKNEPITGVGTISRTFDAAGNLSEESRFGATTDFTYHGGGSVHTKKNPRGFLTTYTNYERGVAKSEARSGLVTIARTIDYFGNVTSETDGESNWGYGYDSLNRITSVNYPSGSDATITWTNTSRSMTRGTLTETRNFDGYGRPTSSTKSGVTTTYNHDALGRKTFESYPGNTSGSTITYDSIGRVEKVVTPAGTKDTSYLSTGTAIKNERGNTTTYTYDRYGSPDDVYLVGVSTPESASITMNKDAIGLLKSVTQGGVSRTYTYTTTKYLDTIVDPETGTTTFGRDANGNMVSKAVGSETIYYCYDGLDRLTYIAFSSACSGISTTRIANEYNGRGQLTKVSNQSAVRDYEYDDNGNLTKDKLTVDGNTFVTSYGYNTIDGLDTITYPLNSAVLTLTPDVFGRPTKVSPHLTSVTHLNSGNLSKIRYANNVEMTFGENSWLLPNSIDSTKLSLDYVYDGVGNVSSMSGTVNRTFCYDGVDRLTHVSQSSGCGGTAEFAYSSTGNITKNGGTSYAYASGRLTGTSGSTARTLTYDGLGNVTGYGGNTFAYDGASNLTCVNCAGSNEIKYAYDGKGNRVWQEKDSKKTYYFHASNNDLLFEYSPYGKVWKEHAYLHGKRIATREGSNATVPTVTINVSASPQYGSPVTLTATVSSGAGTVEFFDGAVSLGMRTLAGTQAALAASFMAGNHVIKTKYSGDANNAPAEATYSLTVAKSAQTITFPALANRNSNELPFSISATASSGLAVAFASTTQSICTTSGLNGSLIALTQAAGLCSITASQTGDTNYNAAAAASRSLTVTKVFTVGAASGNAGGSVSPTTSQIIAQGTTASITVTPNAGYATTIVSTCGGGQFAAGIYTTGPIASDCSVVAYFNLIPVAPGAPVITGNKPGNGQVAIYFDPPASSGGATVGAYIANCSTGLTGTAARSPVIVRGLTNGVAYLCSIVAANSVGTGLASNSISVTPSASATLELISVLSRKNHGSAGAFDLAVDETQSIGGSVTVEPRAIGAGHTLIFQFNQPITDGFVDLVDETGAAIGSGIAVKTGNDTVVTLTGIPDNKRVTVRLSDVNATPLDVSASIGFLIGDANNSRATNATDISAIKARSGTVTSVHNFTRDLNASGGINATDISAVKARSGLVLPAASGMAGLRTGSSLNSLSSPSSTATAFFSAGVGCNGPDYATFTPGGATVQVSLCMTTTVDSTCGITLKPEASLLEESGRFNIAARSHGPGYPDRNYAVVFPQAITNPVSRFDYGSTVSGGVPVGPTPSQLLATFDLLPQANATNANYVLRLSGDSIATVSPTGTCDDGVTDKPLSAAFTLNRN